MLGQHIGWRFKARFGPKLEIEPVIGEKLMTQT